MEKEEFVGSTWRNGKDYFIVYDVQWGVNNSRHGNTVLRCNLSSLEGIREAEEHIERMIPHVCKIVITSFKVME